MCVRGNCVMEDRVGWGNHYLFAIDGASGLTDSKVISNHKSDAAWLAEGMCRGLERLLPCEGMSLQEILQKIAAGLKEEYDSEWKKKMGNSIPDYPSAAVAILRQRKDVVEYLGLGDCAVTVEETQGKIEAITEDRLTSLDHIAIEQMVALRHKTECGMTQVMDYLKTLLIHNRNLRNHQDGYWIFDPSGAGISHARQKSWPANQVKSVAIMTDGFTQLTDTFSLAADMPDLHLKIKEQGLALLSMELFSHQQADPDCYAYPRFKVRDDTSAVWAVLEQEERQ